MTLTCHDFAADMDLYGSYDNPFPIFLNSTFSSYTTGDEHKGVTVCPPEGQTTGSLQYFLSSHFLGHIFLTVDCWQLGTLESSYSLYVTTKSYSLWKTTPLTELPRSEYMAALIDSAYLTTPSGHLYCDHLDYTCSEFWYAYPASDSLIYWPVPPTIKSYLSSNVYGDIQISETPLNGTFSFALLLDYTIGGVTIPVFNRDALPQVILQFGSGRITNEVGDPLSGGLTASFSGGKCDYHQFNEINLAEDDLVDSLNTRADQIEFNALRYRIGSSFFHHLADN